MKQDIQNFYEQYLFSTNS